MDKTDTKTGDLLWCSHCGRTWEQRVGKDEQPGRRVTPDELEQLGWQGPEDMDWHKCPYAGCDGCPLDFSPWAETLDYIRNCVLPEYPDQKDYPNIPEPGVFYPSYPQNFPAEWTDWMPLVDTGQRPVLDVPA